MRSAPYAVVFSAVFGGLVIGCGGNDEGTGGQTVKNERPASGGTQRQTLRDRRGDVLVKPTERTLRDARLDLVSVTLARSGNRLTASFVTAAPPAPGMVHVLETYDRRQLVEGLIEIRHQRDGGVRAVARPPRGIFKPVPVKVVRREAVVRAPLSEYTRERIFKWRAYTVSKQPTSEIRDRVPQGVHDIAFFPAYE